MIQDVECNVNHSWVFLSTPFTYRFVFFIATTHNTLNSKLSKLRLFGSRIICTSFFSYINADTCELSFWHLSACIMLKLQKGWMAGLISGWSTGGVVEQCLSFFGALRWVSLEWWRDLFQWSWWWRQRACYRCLVLERITSKNPSIWKTEMYSQA